MIEDESANARALYVGMSRATDKEKDQLHSAWSTAKGKVQRWLQELQRHERGAGDDAAAYGDEDLRVLVGQTGAQGQEPWAGALSKQGRTAKVKLGRLYHYVDSEISRTKEELARLQGPQLQRLGHNVRYVIKRVTETGDRGS